MSYKPCDDEDNAVSMLSEAISMKDLLAGGEAILQIDPISTMEEGIVNEEIRTRFALSSHDNVDYFSVGKDAVGNEIRGSPGFDSFETFAEKMFNITGNGHIKKRILRQGVDPVIPKAAVVQVHYNAFFEYGDEPFDSTFVLGKPSKFSLVDCIEGLAIAISSMKKKERAQFLIHPDKAYKATGVPPRIPANAHLLYEIELLDFTEINEDDQSGAGCNESKHEFKTILASSKVRYLEANDCFKKADIHGAIIKYNKALAMLERCNLANDEEEKQQEGLLLKMYTNLSVCMNKVSKPRQACNMCKCALRLKPNHAKALFNFGRALLMLSDFQEAKIKLLRAAKIEPNNVEIQAELKKLAAKQLEHNERERVFSERVFNISKS